MSHAARHFFGSLGIAILKTKTLSIQKFERSILDLQLLQQIRLNRRNHQKLLNCDILGSRVGGRRNEICSGESAFWSLENAFELLNSVIGVCQSVRFKSAAADSCRFVWTIQWLHYSDCITVAINCTSENSRKCLNGICEANKLSMACVDLRLLDNMRSAVEEGGCIRFGLHFSARRHSKCHRSVTRYQRSARCSSFWSKRCPNIHYKRRTKRVL